MIGILVELCEISYMIRDFKNKSESDMVIWQLIIGDCVFLLYLFFVIIIIII